MISVDSLFSPMAGQMKPYSPIEPPDQIAKRLGLPEAAIVKLDANENPFGTSPKVLKALSDGKYYHIYPDPAQAQLRSAIALYAGVKPENVVAGTGADELIDLCCRLLLEPGDKVLGFSPTFGYYSHVIALNRGVYVTAPREADFGISLEKAKALDLTGVKLVILCSPNNPSGTLVAPELVDWFLSKNLVVMVDEAYFEFCGQTVVEKVQNHPNLVVLRTFSKCFALAGFRVGYGVMGETLAQGLMRIKPPYSVSVPAEVALLAALADLDHYRAQVAQLVAIRESTLARLKAFAALTPSPSGSNFILCKVTGYPAKDLRDQLEQQGILVRYFDTPELRGYIRISMGTAPQMNRFFAALGRLPGP